MQTICICFLYCRDKLEFTHLRQILLFAFEIFTVCFEFCILCVSPACEAYGRWTPLFAFSGSFRTPFDEYNIWQWLMLLLHLSLTLCLLPLSSPPLSPHSPLSPPLSSLSLSPCLTHIGLCPHLPPPHPILLLPVTLTHIHTALCSLFVANSSLCMFSSLVTFLLHVVLTFMPWSLYATSLALIFWCPQFCDPFYSLVAIRVLHPLR